MVGGFEGKVLYLCVGGGGGGRCCFLWFCFVCFFVCFFLFLFFFFFFVVFPIQWAVGFCENVYFYSGGGPSQKLVLWVPFVQMGSFGMKKKKVPIFRRGLSRKK